MSGYRAMTQEEEVAMAKQMDNYSAEVERQVEAVHTIKHMFPEEFEALRELALVEQLVRRIHNEGEMEGWWDPDMYVASGPLFRGDLADMAKDIKASIGIKLCDIIHRTSEVDNETSFEKECCGGGCPSCIDNGECCNHEEKK